MTDPTDQHDPLEAEFAALRARTPPAPRDFLERTMADALAQMPAPSRPATPARQLWGRWLEAAVLGGAAVAGLSVGYLDLVAIEVSPLGTPLLSSELTEAEAFDDPLASILGESEL